jgi:hypothetical protein
MKITIKITKEEAIEAWKQQNDHIATGDDTTVEIEDAPHSLTISGGATGATVQNVPFLGCYDSTTKTQ